MSDRSTPKHVSENETDDIVVAQADDDSAWDEPIHATPGGSATLSVPSDLVARARFLARIHRKASVEDWLIGVIRDRVDLEEAAFTGLKRELAEQTA